MLDSYHNKHLSKKGKSKKEMRKQSNTAGVFGMGIVLCMVLAGCSGENGNPPEEK